MVFMGSLGHRQAESGTWPSLWIVDEPVVERLAVSQRLSGGPVRDPAEWVPLSRLCEIHAFPGSRYPGRLLAFRAGPAGFPNSRGARRIAEVDLGCSPGLMRLAGLMVPGLGFAVP